MTAPNLARASAFDIAIGLACDKARCQCQQTVERGHGLTHCPGHEPDTHPSLSFDERDGKVLVNCKSGCDQDTVIAALRERGLWPRAERKPPRRRTPGPPPPRGGGGIYHPRSVSNTQTLAPVSRWPQ